MLGVDGDEFSVMPIVYSDGNVTVSSLGSFLSLGSSYKPSHPSLPLSLLFHCIQEYLKKKRGRKRKYTKLQEEKARHEEQRKKMRVTVREKLVVGYWEL